MVNNTKALILDSLGDGIPALDADLAGMMKKSAMVCLNHHKHKDGVLLEIKSTQLESCALHWSDDVTVEMLKRYAGTSSNSASYEPTTRTTDDAACAIALLFIRENTKFTAIEKAGIGTTVDYYLSSQENDSDLIFNNAEARLEVSGILTETPANTIKRRLKEKKDRLLDEGIPTFIVITEFKQPQLLMEEVL